MIEINYQISRPRIYDFRIFSIFEYSVLISTPPLIIAKSMLINGLRPPLFEEERGNEGVS